MTCPDAHEPVVGAEPSDGIEESALRSALRPHAAGVVVATASGPDGPVGLTLTSFAVASLSPPIVSFFLGRRSSTVSVFLDAVWYGVHVLSAEQLALAVRFATPGADRFGPPTEWSSGPTGVPVIGGCITRLICRRHTVLPLGDHYLIAGCVMSAAQDRRGEALVHHQGRLHGL